MNEETPQTASLAVAPLLILSFLKVGLHLFAHGQYGYFRDELYYIACTERLDYGYVDQPPLSIYLLHFARWIFGDSLLAIRLLPALAGGFVVFLTGYMTRQLGGGWFAQSMAALCTVIAPIYLALNGYFSMNSFDLLFWIITAILLVSFLKTRDPKYWLWLGLVLGLGLMNKISALWLSAGIVAGLLLTSDRKLFLSRGPWLTAIIAFLFFLPYILWQFQNDAATLEFIRNATGNKMAETPPLEFILGQIITMHPITFPIWTSGLFFYFSKRGKPFRLLGYIYLFVFLLLIVNQKSRTGYLSPAYPILFAGGATIIEKWIATLGKTWLKPATLLTLTVAGIATAPLALPVLLVESYIRYARALGVEPSTEEKKEIGKLPQFFADMHGWKELAVSVAEVYRKLSPEERSECVIFTQNYGEAGALEFFGKAPHQLPKVISSHNNYWIWGPGNHSGKVAIILGGDFEDHEEFFESVTEAGVFRCDYCMPYEDNSPIYIGRNLKVPLKTLWPELKHYD